MVNRDLRQTGRERGQAHVPSDQYQPVDQGKRRAKMGKKLDGVERRHTSNR